MLPLTLLLGVVLSTWWRLTSTLQDRWRILLYVQCLWFLLLGCRFWTSSLISQQVTALAEKHRTTPAAILLKWAVQRGASVVPKSFNTGRIRENLEAVARPDLPEPDMEALNNLKGPGSYVRFNDPKTYYGFDIYDEENDQPVQTTSRG